MDPKIKLRFSVDDRIALHANSAAKKLGKNLEQAIAEYLEQLAQIELRKQDWELFEARCLTSNAKLNDWKFDRDIANKRHSDS